LFDELTTASSESVEVPDFTNLPGRYIAELYAS
jgi:hypothetical protein